MFFATEVNYYFSHVRVNLRVDITYSKELHCTSAKDNIWDGVQQNHPSGVLILSL